MARTPSDLPLGAAAGCWLLLSAVALPACATSHRIVHHRRAYFEHCHAADYDVSRSTRERTECWSAWLAHHSEGDAPERIQYAQKRLRSLDGNRLQPDDGPSPLPGMDPSAAASYVTFTTLPAGPAPGEGDAPSSVGDHSSPPPEHVSPTHESSVRVDGQLSEPCNPVCAPLLATCVEACTGYGGDCRRACRVEERLCLRACH